MAQKRHQFISDTSSELQEKFINCLMKDGKKTIARKVFLEMLAYIQKKIGSGKNALEIFSLAVDNVMPSTEVKAKRVGGSVYQVPIEVTPKRRRTLAIRWILQCSRKGAGRPIAEKLGDEIIAAANMEGAAVKKKEEVHRMAHANKAFAHMARY